MLIKIALNGARRKEENQFVPHSHGEIRDEVMRLYKAGSKVFHIHSYDENGKESLHPKDVNNLIALVKGLASDIQIGISSGDWIEPDLQKRISYIKQWKNKPDFISVNMIEENAVEVCNALTGEGILIEAGLNEVKAAELFVKSGLERWCCRVLIEPEEEVLSSALQTVNAIEEVLNSNKINVKRLLHGFNAASWDLLREAGIRGYDSRIGMEDTLYLENGIKVKSNLDLINYANKIITESKVKDGTEI